MANFKVLTLGTGSLQCCLHSNCGHLNLFYSNYAVSVGKGVLSAGEPLLCCSHSESVSSCSSILTEGGSRGGGIASDTVDRQVSRAPPSTAEFEISIPLLLLSLYSSLPLSHPQYPFPASSLLGHLAQPLPLSSFFLPSFLPFFSFSSPLSFPQPLWFPLPPPFSPLSFLPFLHTPLFRDLGLQCTYSKTCSLP